MQTSTTTQSQNSTESSTVTLKGQITAAIVAILLLVSAYDYFLGYMPGEHSRAFATMITTPGQWLMALVYGLGTLLFPAIHIAIFSIFKSKRNGNTRCNILLGWAVFILITKVLFIIVG